MPNPNPNPNPSPSPNPNPNLKLNLGKLMSSGMEDGAALGPLLALGLVSGDRRTEPSPPNPNLQP